MALSLNKYPYIFFVERTKEKERQRSFSYFRILQTHHNFAMNDLGLFEADRRPFFCEKNFRPKSFLFL